VGAAGPRPQCIACPGLAARPVRASVRPGGLTSALVRPSKRPPARPLWANNKGNHVSEFPYASPLAQLIFHRGGCCCCCCSNCAALCPRRWSCWPACATCNMAPCLHWLWFTVLFRFGDESRARWPGRLGSRRSRRRRRRPKIKIDGGAPALRPNRPQTLTRATPTTITTAPRPGQYNNNLAIFFANATRRAIAAAGSLLVVVAH
jgi:hypothetical protein